MYFMNRIKEGLRRFKENPKRAAIKLMSLGLVIIALGLASCNPPTDNTQWVDPNTESTVAPGQLGGGNITEENCTGGLCDNPFNHDPSIWR
jgi:hypothetical protein